jgi:ligand-binding sensor domain-containing protein
MIVQDSRGFLWIGTRNGLSRFDGIEFVNYFRKDGLPSNFVNNLFEDKNFAIWALSTEGLSRYNGSGFEYFPVTPALKGWSFSFGASVDSSNNFYLTGMKEGALKHSLSVFTNGVYSDYCEQFPALDTLDISGIQIDPVTQAMILIDARKTIWLWKDKILSRLLDRKFERIYADRGRIFAISGDTTFRYSDYNFEINNRKATPGRPEVTVKSALLRRELEFFDGRDENRLSLKFNSIGYIIDKEGMLWFSSEKNIYRLLSTSFRELSEEDIGAENLWAICDDRNGHLWFGTLYGSLIEFDGSVFIERNDFKPLFGSDVGFYKGSRKMSNGDTWFSTNSGVLIWDGKSFSRLKGIPDATQICYIYEDPDNKIVMIGTEKGLFLLEKGKIKLFPEFNDNSLGVIEGITKDNNGTYWLSGHRGILRFDGRNAVPANENILPQGYTYTIEKDSYGGLWVTSEEGLYFRGKSSEIFNHGLPAELNRPANSICIMDSTHLLVGRTSDICLIDLEKFYRDDKDYFKILDKTDGFQGSDCLDNGIVKDQSGRFWILTSDRVVIFYPDKLKQNPHPPEISIRGFYYQSDSLNWEQVDNSDFFYSIPENIRLTRLQNNIQIAYTGISTTNPEKTEYSYRLGGYDDKWSLPVNKRSVIYEKLPPGHYRFELKAINSDGIETAKPLVMEFRVLPALWQTTGFIITASLLIIILTVIVTLLIMRRRQQKKDERARLKSELTTLQMSSVLKQFDPHFTFNVISSVGSLIMKGEKESAYDYITKLSSLLRSVLGDGSLIIKPLSEELDFVRKYCELQKLRFKERFSFAIVIDENVDLQREIPKMTIQTFVENAIKHGIENRKKGGKVEIIVGNAEDGLLILVRDNGIGRAAASMQKTGGTGYGQKIVNSLFEVMNSNNRRISKVEVLDLMENGNPSGTEVRISIPDGYRFEFGKLSKEI